MKTLDEIRSFFQDDHFAIGAGMRIDSVSEDGAVCSVELNKGHTNAIGNTQGGVIFTLADFAFAVAVNGQQCCTVTLNSTISFLRQPKGKRLTAAASCFHKSKNICLYNISVTDELDTPVAQVSITGYTISTPPVVGTGSQWSL